MSRPLVAALVLAAGLASAAEGAPATGSPFAGRWKLNAAKSQLVGDSLTFEEVEGGAMKLTAAGKSYTFKLDGKRAPAFFGYDAAWRRIDARTLESVSSLGGKQPVTERYQLSADGRNIAYVARGTKPDGRKFVDRVEYERVSGDRGFAGTWRSRKADWGGLTTVEFAGGGDELVMRLPDWKGELRARLDGKDYPYASPGAPPGITYALTPEGDRRIALVQKRNGEPQFTGAWTVSDDGQSLAWDWKPASVDEPLRGVFDRVKGGQRSARKSAP